MPLDVAAAKQSCAATGRPEAEPMIVLATGTGGFVGSATALVLKQRGHGVVLQRRAACTCASHALREGAHRPHLSGPMMTSPSSAHSRRMLFREARSGGCVGVLRSVTGCAETLCRCAGVLGLDNFNDYYPVALKRARQV